jgi:L-lysine 2,3-aminomutase
MQMKTYHRKNLRQIPALASVPEQRLEVMELVASVLPFKVNNYVVDELIDWSDPGDPMFQLTFPQPGMLEDRHLHELRDAAPEDRDELARRIQLELNPHPSGQALNVPRTEQGELQGIQHKYPTTALFFPSQGQTCHSYCTYCFRWPQFVGLEELKFRNKDIDVLLNYLRANPQVTDVLFTGGDPMIMRTPVLERYVRPLLEPEFEHVNIRIGSKALAYWPQRFVTDPDADDLLRLFSDVRAAGRVLAFQAHYSAEVELSTDIAEQAIRRVLDAGAVIRTQAPVINHVNASADAWEGMLRRQLQLNMIPYYMFVERDTGARNYFELPLVQALDIYREATRRLTGLTHTLRGPVMSATPGKVHVNDVIELEGQRLFVLKMLQARDVANSHRVFFAEYDQTATWFDDLNVVDLAGRPDASVRIAG